MGVLVDITTRCNMTCGHCMWSRTQQGEDMTEEVFRAALKMAPVRGYGTFSFGSGEPTVHPQFWKFIEIALEDKRWNVRVVTNGKLTETALRLAELGKQGILEAHLSLDKWHDKIDQSVIDAFKRDPTLKGDKRAYRFCEDSDLKNIGRCDFAKDKRPSCRCPVPKITTNGNVYFCGCEQAIAIGHVLTGWDEGAKKNYKKLNCTRWIEGADKTAPSRFFGGVQSALRNGSTNKEQKESKRNEFAKIISNIQPHLEALGEIKIMGSYGRGSDTPNDLDILLISDSVIDIDDLASKIGASKFRTHQSRTSFLVNGLKVEVFRTPKETQGAAELYLEGPLARNAELRKTAIKNGLVWKFQGLFSQNGERLPCDNKITVFETILNKDTEGFK